MIKWREGKAGFVGSAKRLIRGVFSFNYSKTSVEPVSPYLAVGSLSVITSIGAGTLSTITAYGAGSLSALYPTVANLSVLTGYGAGNKSTITDYGAGNVSEL